MNNELFLYILKNQRKWELEYRQQKVDIKEIRKILNRKWESKCIKSKDWIKNELIKSLQIGELELIDCLAERGFHHLDLFEKEPTLDIQKNK